MVGVDGGIHEMLYQSIMKCDANRREELFGNIVVSGGTSLLPGMIDRLQQETHPQYNDSEYRCPSRTQILRLGRRIHIGVHFFEVLINVGFETGIQ